MTLSIPVTRDGVKQFVEALEADRELVAATSVESLESRIDDTICDLFNLTHYEREVIEKYLVVF